MESLDPNGHSRIELLAPAGNFEKLEYVLHYGADAVYLAGKAFSLRNFADNFTLDELEASISLAHAYRAKVYVAVNAIARNQDLPPLEKYLNDIGRIRPDGLIIADPAIICMAHNVAPGLAIHLSTQANTTNLATAAFWHAQGVCRINLARELTLVEIAEIARRSKTDIEAFVHGAMCISYSGRCLLSNFMAQRSSNQGSCCQPCRFEYAVMEATRPGQYFPLAEDGQGSYVFNSKDLCMLAHLPDVIRAGVRAAKIEGRMKGIHYAATAVKIYREAIDSYYKDPEDYSVAPYWQSELDKITARGYCTGFYFGDPTQIVPQYSAPRAGDFQLVGNVIGPRSDGMSLIEVRNRIHTLDQLEVITPHGPPKSAVVNRIVDQDGHCQCVAQPGSRVAVELGLQCAKFDLLRKHRLDESISAAQRDTATIR
jgi:putative protease